MKELIDRWKSKSPEFWIKVKKIALVIGTSAVGVWTINSTMGLDLDKWIIEICKYSIGIAAEKLKEMSSAGALTTEVIARALVKEYHNLTRESLDI